MLNAYFVLFNMPPTVGRFVVYINGLAEGHSGGLLKAARVSASGGKPSDFRLQTSIFRLSSPLSISIKPNTSKRLANFTFRAIKTICHHVSSRKEVPGAFR
jgi:hypothetical protein